MPGLGDIDENLRIEPPHGAHEFVYQSIDDATAGKFRTSSHGKRPKKRRGDYLLGLALFADVPKTESCKTRMYFAADMVAKGRDVRPSTVVNNYRAIVPESCVEKNDRFDAQVDVVAWIFSEAKKELEKKLAGSETTRSEVIETTLTGVRDGKSYFARWGNAREGLKDAARNPRGKFDL